VNEELVSAALLGTARKQPDFRYIDVGIDSERLSGDPATVLLNAAALEFAYERGALAATPATIPEAAEDDPRYLLPSDAVGRVLELLATRSPVLGEWFAEAQRRDYRAPDESMASLLAFAASSAEHRRSILRLAGTRGQWLAKQNSEWADLVAFRPADVDIWTHGATRDRRRWLAELREADPAAARSPLAATWSSETGTDRAAFLAQLEVGLNNSDEDLLESALDDGRREVRETAARLLRRLPHSRYGERMAARARSWLHVEGGDHVTVSVPTSIDTTGRRDGISDNDFRATNKRAAWLLQVVGATPLGTWADLFDSPARAVASGIDADWHMCVVRGWAQAAVAQADSEWADALIDESHADIASLLTQASEAARERYILGSTPALLTAPAPNPLSTLRHPWSREVCLHVLKLILERSDGAVKELRRTRTNSPAGADAALRLARANFPIEAFPAVRAAADRCADPGWAQSLNAIAHTLIQRKTMLEELQ